MFPTELLGRPGCQAPYSVCMDEGETQGALMEDVLMITVALGVLLQ